MSDTERLRDAAFAANIDTGWEHAVAGYYGGPGAYHVWSRKDWARFASHKKLPVWVAAQGDKNGTIDGKAAVAALAALGVPGRVWTVLDMETMVDKTYVEAFGAELRAAHYKIWIYGSASTVFGNPELDGYWVAGYHADGQPYMFDHPDVRATQYASGPDFDSSTVHDFTWHERPRWWI